MPNMKQNLMVPELEMQEVNQKREAKGDGYEIANQNVEVSIENQNLSQYKVK